MGGRETLCPVSGVSRNEGLDSRLFSATSAHGESAAAGGSCFPFHPRKRLPVLPRPAGGCSPAVAAEHIWPGRGRRSAARRGCPASAPFPGERARDRLGTRVGRAERPRVPGCTGSARRRLVLPGHTSADLGGDPAVHHPGGFREAVRERAPGMELPRPGFGAGCLRVALHLSRVCFRIWSSVKLYPLELCQIVSKHYITIPPPPPPFFFFLTIFPFLFVFLSHSTLSWIMNGLFFYSFLPISKQRLYRKVSAGLLNPSLGFPSFFSFLSFFS